MLNFPILSTIILMPLIGVLLLLFIKSDNEESTKANIFKLSLFVSIFTFIISVILLLNYNKEIADFQFIEKSEWFEGASIYYFLGVDGMSAWLAVLTCLLVPICLICGRKSINFKFKSFAIAFLLLESLVLGVFFSLDFFLFYVFFEASLIPMFIIIGIWGGKDRIYASFKFFLYTLAGSLLLLLAIIYIYIKFGTTDIVSLIADVSFLDLSVQKWLWWAFFLSFAVKLPMFPVHSWLPSAHVQAPTAGSVILAGILLKLGGYGFIRFSITMLPDASNYYQDFVYILSIISLVYGSLLALSQTDMKKVIAYSSIAHMAYVTLGIFSFNQSAVEGAIYTMISHGIVSAALFICVGVLYDRMNTKEIAKFGGVASVMPRFAMLLMVFTMSSVALPGTSGFVGEFLVLNGLFLANNFYGLLATSGVVLGAIYMLLLYKNVMYGKITNPQIAELKDIDKGEKITLYILAALTIIIGIYPELILSYLHVSIANLY